MAVRQRRGGHPHSRAASSRPNPGSARMMAATASLPFLRPPGLRRAVPASCPLPLAPAVPSGPRQQARLGPADRMLLRQGPLSFCRTDADGQQQQSVPPRCA